MPLRRKPRRDEERRSRQRRSRRPAAQMVANRPDSDQTLLDLVNGMRELTERIGVLEHRFDALGTRAAVDPDSEDVMELRLHVARLSAEVSRVTVGLEARIAEVATNVGVALVGDPVLATIPPTGLRISTPVLAGDETFEDLSADSPARARGAQSSFNVAQTGRTSGWQPVEPE